MNKSSGSASPRAIRRGAGRPTRDQADARQKELLDRALDLFLEHGFEMTTMEGIASAVGMTKRTVYARYRDKAALFLAVVQHAIQQSLIPADRLAALDPADLKGALLAVARMRVANVMTPDGLRLQRIINAESYRFPEIFTMSYDQSGKPVVAFLARLLADHHLKGKIHVERPELAANIFMSMVVSGPVRIIVSGNTLTPEEMEDRISYAVHLFLNGVGDAAIASQVS